MPETNEIADLSTEIDRMLASAQAFSEFAAEAQRIGMALQVKYQIVNSRIDELNALEITALYQPQHTGYRDGQPTDEEGGHLYYE